jgi:hypothetical protein
VDFTSSFIHLCHGRKMGVLFMKDVKTFTIPLKTDFGYVLHVSSSDSILFFW